MLIPRGLAHPTHLPSRILCGFTYLRRMTSGPWTVYARQLFPLSYGHPLWGPEPCLTFGQVHLGDVGYLKEGHFSMLFNATKSADHPVNSLRGVPDGFQVLDIPDHMVKRRPNEITQPLLHSKSLQSTSITAAASVRYDT